MGLSYSIMSPGLAGIVNDTPDIKLQDVASPNSSNVLIEDGEIVTSPLRLVQGIDNNGNQIIVPEEWFTIIEANNWDMIPNPENPSENPSWEPYIDDPSVSSTLDPNTIELSGISLGISATDTIYLMNNNDGSDYNDGSYTVDSVVEDSGNTLVTTVEDILYDTGTQGYVFTGYTPILHIHSLVTNGSEQTYIFTANSIFRWEFASKILTPLTLPVALNDDVEYWSVDQGVVNFGTLASPSNSDGLIVCHNQGSPLKISSSAVITELTATVDSAATTITNAKVCKFYENILLLGNVTLSTGSEYPKRFYRSDILDTANFGENSDTYPGTQGWNDTEGFDDIQAFGLSQNVLLIFKTETILQSTFIGEDFGVLRIDGLSRAIGCLSPGSIVNDRQDNLYFFGTDKRIKTLHGQDITDAIDKTITEVKDDIILGITSHYNKNDDRLLWSIPFGPSATENNKIITLKDGAWSFLDISVSAFNNFKRLSTLTWDAVPDNVTWDNVAGTWNSVTGEIGSVELLTGDYDGNLGILFGSYQDLDSDYTSSVEVATDLANSQALDEFKRITSVRFYFRPISENSTVTFSVSKDNDIAFEEITTFNTFNINKDLVIINRPMSYRCKSMKLKISSTDKFQLVGMILFFNVGGNR